MSDESNAIDQDAVERHRRARELIGRNVSTEELDQFFATAMEVGQQLFLAAWRLGGGPVGAAAILDAAWALAAAQAEDHQVLGEKLGLLIDVEARLRDSANGIRKFYYPEWRRLLKNQGGSKTS